MATPARRAACGPRGAKAVPGQFHRSASGATAPLKNFHQRAFAGAVFADQRQHLAAAGLERDVRKRPGCAESSCSLPTFATAPWAWQYVLEVSRLVRD